MSRTVREYLMWSIKDALKPFVNEQATADSVEAVKETIMGHLKRSWEEDDIHFPLCLHVTARDIRNWLPRSCNPELPNEAVLWLLRVEPVGDMRPNGSLTVCFAYTGQWRKPQPLIGEPHVWPATEFETVLGLVISK